MALAIIEVGELMEQFDLKLKGNNEDVMNMFMSKLMPTIPAEEVATLWGCEVSGLKSPKLRREKGIPEPTIQFKPLVWYREAIYEALRKKHEEAVNGKIGGKHKIDVEVQSRVAELDTIQVGKSLKNLTSGRKSKSQR